MNKTILLGNWQYSGEGGAGYAGATFDKEGISPTLNTMQGGNRQPMIVVEVNDVSNRNTTD